MPKKTIYIIIAASILMLGGSIFAISRSGLIQKNETKTENKTEKKEEDKKTEQATPKLESDKYVNPVVQKPVVKYEESEDTKKWTASRYSTPESNKLFRNIESEKVKAIQEAKPEKNMFGGIRETAKPFIIYNPDKIVYKSPYGAGQFVFYGGGVGNNPLTRNNPIFYYDIDKKDKFQLDTTKGSANYIYWVDESRLLISFRKDIENSTELFPSKSKIDDNAGCFLVDTIKKSTQRIGSFNKKGLMVDCHAYTNAKGERKILIHDENNDLIMLDADGSNRVKIKTMDQENLLGPDQGTYGYYNLYKNQELIKVQF